MKRSRFALMMFLAMLAALCQTVGSAGAQRGFGAGIEQPPHKFACPGAPEDYRPGCDLPYEDDQWYGDYFEADSCHAESQAAKQSASPEQYQHHGGGCFEGLCGDYYSYAALPAGEPAREIAEYEYAFQKSGQELADRLNRENEGLQAAAYGLASDLPAGEAAVLSPSLAADASYDRRSQDWSSYSSEYGYEEDLYEYEYNGQYGASDLHPDNLPPAESLESHPSDLPLDESLDAHPENLPPAESFESPSAGPSAGYGDYQDDYEYDYQDDYEHRFESSNAASNGNAAASLDTPPAVNPNAWPSLDPAASADADRAALGELVRAALQSASRMLEGMGHSLIDLSHTIDSLAGESDEDQTHQMPRPWPATLGCPPRNTPHLGL